VFPWSSLASGALQLCLVIPSKRTHVPPLMEVQLL